MDKGASPPYFAVCCVYMHYGTEPNLYGIYTRLYVGTDV